MPMRPAQCAPTMWTMSSAPMNLPPPRVRHGRSLGSRVGAYRGTSWQGPRAGRERKRFVATRPLVLICFLVALTIPSTWWQNLPAHADTPSSSGCPDVAIYGVPGSGQNNLQSEYGMGPEVHTFADELLHRIPATDRVLQVGDPYPAAGPGSAILNGALGDNSAYNQSVLEGAQLLVDGGENFEGISQLVVRCPHVSLVIAGISQGAQVITTALAQASRPTPITARIKAVILFASPVRLHGESFNVGVDEQNGIFAGADAQPGHVQARIPAFLVDHTRSYCLTDDPICSFTAGDLARHQVIHTSYVESLFELQAADFAARRLGVLTPWVDVARTTASKILAGAPWQTDEDRVSIAGIGSDVSSQVDNAFAAVAVQEESRISAIFTAPPPAGSQPGLLTIRAVSRYASPDVASVLYSVEEGSPQAAHVNTWYQAVTVDLASGQTIAGTDLLTSGSSAPLARQLAATYPTACAQSGNTTLIGQQVFADALTQIGDSAVALALGANGLQLGFGNYALQGGLGCHPALAIGYGDLSDILDPRWIPDPGRVQNGAAFNPSPMTYVALGDSYAAGEGTNDYFGETSIGEDSCHRSPLAYASLLGAVESANQFRACSGATINNLNNLYKGEPPQPVALSTNTDLVTLSVGGDDIGFSSVVQKCVDIFINQNSDSNCYPAINSAYAKLFDGSQGGPNDLDTRLNNANCGAVATFQTGTCQRLITNAELATTHPSVSLYQNLTALLHDIHYHWAQNARIIVIGYPSLFPTFPYFPSSTNVSDLNVWDFSCGGVHPDWQQALAQAAGIMDGVIAQAAFDSGAEFIDPTNAFIGHDACNSQQRWINDLNMDCFAGNGTQNLIACSESYHPNPDGYRELRHLIYAQLDADLLTPPITVRPAATVTVTSTDVPALAVPQGSATFDVHVRWPGSTVSVILRDPHGADYTGGALPNSITRTVTSTSEDWVIHNPAPGSWKVLLYGAVVSLAGEPVAVTAQATPARFPRPKQHWSWALAIWAAGGATVILFATAMIRITLRRRLTRPRDLSR